MFHRLSVGALWVTLAAASAAAGPPATTPATTAITYTINDHNRQVTVTDGDGKTLLTCRAATPTVTAIVTKGPAPALSLPAAGGLTPAQAAALRPAVLTLEDGGGARLWSTTVPVAPPLRVNFTVSSGAQGLQLAFRHDAGDDAADPKQPPPSRLAFLIGADGRLARMTVDGKTFRIVAGPNGVSLVGPDGKPIATVGADGAPGPPGGPAHITLNGVQIPITHVVRDGKGYLSFPWNGHTVFVQDTCTFTVTGDGDLTVNAPAAPASK